MSFDDILAQASRLAPHEKRRLVAALAAQLEQPVAEAPAHPARDASVIAQGASAPVDFGIYPNGLDPDSGMPLVRIPRFDRHLLAAHSDEGEELRQIHQLRVAHDRSVLGLVYGISYDDLAEAGWAIVVPYTEDAGLIRALTPLIEHRACEQGLRLPRLDFRAGETCGAWLARHVVDPNRPLASDADCQVPVLIYRPGEDAASWLGRHGTSPRAVDPALGVPFYLLLVGSPGPRAPGDTAFIPFEFQYQLDLFWGVGRLCFTDRAGGHRLPAYATYAERLVAYEQRAVHAPARHIAYFGTEHPADPATQASANELLLPLFQGRPGALSAADRYGFTQELRLGSRANRGDLQALLRGTSDGGRPALLVSATHGLGFPADDSRLPAYQGALVCQDWGGSGPLRREHWFAGEDLDQQTRVDGLIVLLVACYGLGCPREDQFAWHPGEPARIIAPRPLIAQLPQELLLHGALAVFGHVDRAWTCAFRSHHVRLPARIHRAAGAQIQAFDDLLRRLMDGKRLGFATDQFNAVQGVLALDLSDLLAGAIGASEPDLLLLEASLTWAARNDLRNYAVLGDPAVRLHSAETVG